MVNNLKGKVKGRREKLRKQGMKPSPPPHMCCVPPPRTDGADVSRFVRDSLIAAVPEVEPLNPLIEINTGGRETSQRFRC